MYTHIPLNPPKSRNDPENHKNKVDAQEKHPVTERNHLVPEKFLGHWTRAPVIVRMTKGFPWSPTTNTRDFLSDRGFYSVVGVEHW
jgi:hypothetical protein